jgi:hypothetical protein
MHSLLAQSLQLQMIMYHHQHNYHVFLFDSCKALEEKTETIYGIDNTVSVFSSIDTFPVRFR